MSQKMLMQEHLYGAVNSTGVVGVKMLRSERVELKILTFRLRESIILDISKRWGFFQYTISFKIDITALNI